MLNNNLNNILLADNKVYVDGAIIDNNGINLDGVAQNDAYLYYCGTAPTKQLISFSINIEKSCLHDSFLPYNASRTKSFNSFLSLLTRK